jgi:hypothetical protein
MSAVSAQQLTIPYLCENRYSHVSNVESNEHRLGGDVRQRAGHVIDGSHALGIHMSCLSADPIIGPSLPNPHLLPCARATIAGYQQVRCFWPYTRSLVERNNEAMFTKIKRKTGIRNELDSIHRLADVIAHHRWRVSLRESPALAAVEPKWISQRSKHRPVEVQLDIVTDEANGAHFKTH